MSIDPTGGRLLCLQCSYDLRGLPADGACPECGTAIEHSMRGNQLCYSSSDYRLTLERGLVLILGCLVAKLVLTIGAVPLVGVALSGAVPMSAEAVHIASGLLDTVVEALALLGWWMFSRPDPAVVGAETGQRARVTLRVTAVTTLALAFLSMAIDFTRAPTEIALVLSTLFALAWIAKFYSSLIYTRWIARRIPDEHAFNRADRLRWLGPLLLVLGFPTLGITAIMALVLYWNMLNWVRRDLVAMRP